MSIASQSAAPAGEKCACNTCQCLVPPGQGVSRDGKTYCSSACAYDCTDTTCVCVHDRCETDDGHGRDDSR
jgi:hypothetical protein